MRKRTIILLIAAVIAAVGLITALIVSNEALYVQKYDIALGVSGDIVFISDLHGKSFGEDNERLIGKIAEIEPDVILLGGDFIDADNTQEDNERFLALVENLCEISSVYYSPGNHDKEYFQLNGEAVLGEIADSGAKYLDYYYVDLPLEGGSLRLGGCYDYAFPAELSEYEYWSLSKEYVFLTSFCNTENAKLLVSHRPDAFIYGGGGEMWDIDLILSGHTHGGLWRLPFIGGLMAPEQGIFPEYDKGYFSLGASNMIISTGLSGYEYIPRLFNRPEITHIALS